MGAEISFTAKIGREYKTIHIDQITHFVRDSKYVTAYYPGGELLLTESIAGLESRLDDRFIRCHRAVLLARDRIVSIQPCGFNTEHSESSQTVVLRGTELTPPVSRRLSPSIRRLIAEMKVRNLDNCVNAGKEVE